MCFWLRSVLCSSGVEIKTAYKLCECAPGIEFHGTIFFSVLCRCATYATPIADLVIDKEVVGQLKETGMFEDMQLSVDEDVGRTICI